MSEPSPEQDPLMDPAELRRLEEALRAVPSQAVMSDMIEQIAGIHARWYQAWQEAGVPERRAAEWAGIMIGISFGAVS